MNGGLRNALWAFLLFAGYVVLGLLVSHAPPGALDRAGDGFVGHGVGFALLLTRLGMLPAYALICVVLLIFALLRRAWLSRVVFSIGTLILAWCVSDTGKLMFARPRMEHWIALHETSSSYASGHATLSLVFYGLWLHYLLRVGDLSLAWKRAVSIFLMCLIAGIGWSRLALGAHYITDIIGGYFLGGALLSAAGGCGRLFFRTNCTL
jgi:membrane-associated phospholipid phosphatase